MQKNMKRNHWSNRLKRNTKVKGNVKQMQNWIYRWTRTTLVPKKVYYDSTTSTIVIDFGDVVGKIKKDET